MKTITSFTCALARRSSRGLWALGLAFALTSGLPVGAHADAPPATNAAPANVSTKAAQVSALSPGVEEIIKLARADVSPLVMRTFIECAPKSPQLTSADVVALKEGRVPDEVVTLLLHRGAQARNTAALAKADANTRATNTRLLASGGFDPESYEYFQYYHLRTRTLATAAQRLGPHGYGFGGPHGFGWGNSYLLRHIAPPVSWRP